MSFPVTFRPSCPTCHSSGQLSAPDSPVRRTGHVRTTCRVARPRSYPPERSEHRPLRRDPDRPLCALGWSIGERTNYGAVFSLSPADTGAAPRQSTAEIYVRKPLCAGNAPTAPALSR